jgi:chromosomal replication initiator protein
MLPRDCVALGLGLLGYGLRWGCEVNDIDTDVVAAIVQEVAAQVGELRFNLWFKDNARLEMTDHELVVGVPNLFFQEWLNSNFLAPLRKATETVTGRKLPVRMVVDGEMFRASRSREDKNGPKPETAKPDKPPGHATVLRRSARRGQTLDNFVVGPSNRMAHAAALRIAQEPTAQFNPLILYGPLGLGKTHLLRGIAQAAREQHRGLQVLYLAAEAFTNSFLEDMRGGRLAAFRQRVRGADLLVIDDIQFMASKRATQNELLHTFEALDAEGRQIVLATDQHPRLIEDFSEQLANRLMAGMACPVEPPDFDTRVGILDQKSQTLGLHLHSDVLEFVASHFRTNVRELEGALHCLKAQAEFTRHAIDLAAAQQALAELMRHSTKTVNLAEVEQAICQAFEVKPEQLRSSSRSRSVSQPRMLAMYLARKYTDAAYEAIGKHFGGRNHSTVMFAERKVQMWIDKGGSLLLAGRPWQIADAIRAIEQRLK